MALQSFILCKHSICTTIKKPLLPGCENIVFLIPVAAGLEADTEELRERYFQKILERMEKHTGESIRDAIVYKRSYSVK